MTYTERYQQSRKQKFEQVINECTYVQSLSDTSIIQTEKIRGYKQMKIEKKETPKSGAELIKKYRLKKENRLSQLITNFQKISVRILLVSYAHPGPRKKKSGPRTHMGPSFAPYSKFHKTAFFRFTHRAPIKVLGPGRITPDLPPSRRALLHLV